MEEDTSVQCEILTHILHSLLRMTRYDDEEFVTPARFETICAPLIGQLSSIPQQKRGEGEREESMVFYVGP